MPRAKRGFKARRRRNRILKHASGFHSARSRLFAYAKEVVMKAWVGVATPSARPIRTMVPDSHGSSNLRPRSRSWRVDDFIP